MFFFFSDVFFFPNFTSHLIDNLYNNHSLHHRLYSIPSGQIHVVLDIDMVFKI